MAVTLEKSGDERALADWGIDTESPVLTLRSFSADEFSFSLSVQNALAVAPFLYGDEVILRQAGEIIFRGTIRRRPVFGGPVERQRFVALNFWGDLERLVYEQFRNIIDEDFEELNLVATTQVVFGRSVANGYKIPTASEMEQLVDFANRHGVPLAADFDFEDLVAPWEQANDVTVASGLRRMAAWQPDILGRADYSTNPPQLRLRRPNDDDELAVDLTAQTSILSIEGERRDDLKPAGVHFNFLTTEVNEATGERFARVVQQFAGPLFSGPGVIKSTISIGEGEEVPGGLASFYYASLSTVFLEGRLTVKAADILTTYKPGQLLVFSNAPADWEGASAPVVEVVHQLGNGVSVVTFGPPTFLPASSFAALNSRAKDSRSNGVPGDAGEGGTGNADTGRAGPSGPVTETTGNVTHCVDGEQKTDTFKKG